MAKDRILRDSKTGERLFVHGDTGHVANMTNPRPERKIKTPDPAKRQDTKTRGMFDE